MSAGIDAAFGWLDPDRRLVINNPVDVAAFDGGAVSKEPLVAAMGRLTTEKGFDLLIDAFAQTRARHPEWALTILGEGPERPRLEDQVRSLGLERSVSLPGAVHDVAPVLARAGVFALSSRFEGFGNVLIEAMASRTPIVSFDCPVGPAGLIDDGTTGLLVPPEDVRELASGLDRLMTDADLRTRLASNARTFVERFDLDPVTDRWEELVFELAPPQKSEVPA